MSRQAHNSKSTWRSAGPKIDASLQVARRAGAVADAGLLGVLFVAPLVLGGRHDAGRFALAACVAVAAVGTAVRQYATRSIAWRSTSANWLFVAGAALLALQIVPLPETWMATLAPLRTGLVAPWRDTAAVLGAAGENVASLNPEATRLSLVMWVVYALLFATVAQRLDDVDDVHRLQRWVGLAAVAMAAVGLLQAAFPNGRFLWVYQHPARVPGARICGPFINSNHFGHFLVLGLPCLAAWAAGRRPAEDRQPPRGRSAPGPLRPATGNWRSQIGPYAPVALVMLVAVASIATASRGVAIALLAAAVAFLPGIWRRPTFRTAGASSAALLMAALAGTMFMLAPDDASQRIATLASGEVEEVDHGEGRRKIWQANWEIVKQNGWLGAGAGTHVDAYRTFLPDPPITEYTHAENGYLQVLSENGRAGGLLLACGAALALAWCWRAHRLAGDHPCFLPAVAAAASLIASLAHSAVDFVWYIPACLSLTLVQAACLMRLLQLSAQSSPSFAAPLDRPSRLGSALVPLGATAALVAAAALYGPARSASHWDAYLRISRAQRTASQRLLERGLPDSPEKLREIQISQQAALATMIDELSLAVSHRPRFADAHRQLANRCVQLFELTLKQSDNPMPVSEIRDAAIASQFASSTDLLRWLKTAFGEPVRLLLDADLHARAAVACCPLEGDAYLRIAELAFLHGRGDATIAATLEQALRVRPYDGELLLAAGSHAATRGENERAFELWQRSFAVRGPHRLQLAGLVAANMPPSAWIEWLRPEWDSLPVFWQTAAPLTDALQQQEILAYAERRLDAEAADLPASKASWLRWRLAEMQHEAGRTEAAVASLERAVAENPNNGTARKMLGMYLAELDRLPEAEQQLAWYYGRYPTDSGVQRKLADVRKQRIAAANSGERQTYLR